MKIGIIGTRGIPNLYGGFEQFAEQFSVRLAALGHEVFVYCSGNHIFKGENYKSVHLIHCFDPENLIGTAGQFIYDFNCIMHSRKQHFDLILQLGYTSSTVWSWLLPSGSVIATNMDGQEWKRSKYNVLTRWFLGFAEKWAVDSSDYLIADSIGIQMYLRGKYKADSCFLAYGAQVYHPGSGDLQVLENYELSAGNYDLLIARFEPENNIETIIKAYLKYPEKLLVLIGNYNANTFGKRLFTSFSSAPNIRFLGAIFNVAVLNALRYHSALYLHGHSVGGTNPSLLEAMACSALICANNNIFNRAVLGDDAFYFSTESDISGLIFSGIRKEEHRDFITNNLQKIEEQYNWDHLTLKTEALFQEWIESEKYGQQVSAA